MIVARVCRAHAVASAASRIARRACSATKSCCFSCARRSTTTMRLMTGAQSASTSSRSSTVAARASAASSHSSLPSPFATSSPFSTSSASFSTSPPLSPEDTAAAARLARVAGLAYSSTSELPVLLRETGHELVEDLGETFFTRAFVADDVRGDGGGGRTRGRVVAFRGLAWSGSERSDPLRLGAALAKVWPVPVGERDEGAAAVVAHGGVAELARETALLVRRLVRSTPPTTPVTFVGHSLGGALALATAVVLASEGEVGCGPDNKSTSAASCRRPVRVVSFGAPPSLAPASGDGDLDAALARVFGPGFPLSPSPSAPPTSAVTSFFAEGDPVPRWLLSSDPTFSAAAASFPPLSIALQLRSWLGASVFSTRRMLYEHAGDSYLISWTPSRGHRVSPLPRDGPAVSEALGEAALEGGSPAAVAAAAARDVFGRASSAAAAAAGGGVGVDASSGSNLRRAIGFLLDHAHASYADDLKAAAIQARKKRDNGKSGEKKKKKK